MRENRRISKTEHGTSRGVCTAAILAATVGLASCKSAEPVACKHWKVSPPVFLPLETGAFENVAVKDPSIVYFDGKYHLFYTGKRVDQTDKGAKYSITTGYVAAPTLEGLNSAKRYNLSAMVDANIIAPQIFYFAPQKLWYIMAHRYDRGNKPNLQPIYLTNPDINNVHGWSKPQDLATAKRTDGFWIDFWVICDDRKAHLFSMDQTGAVLRMECPIADFPQGFATATDSEALFLRGEDEIGKWIAFEAEHVYHVKNPDKYFMILEGGYYKDSRKYFGDARKRFLVGLVADQLEGPWTRVEQADHEYFGQGTNLFNEDGSRSAYTQVSHPELIRSGYDQKLEIENFNIDMIFQSFNGAAWPDNYHYNELPWELAIMRNY